MLQPDRHRDAEGFAGRDIAHHDLFARRRGLAGPYVTVQQHEERMRVLALFEYRAVLRKSHRARFAENLAKFVRGKSRKQRQVGDQGRVDGGHVSSAARDFYRI